ncbi:MAG: Phenylacetic acid catabolic protein [Acidobacteriota bacterium]
MPMREARLPGNYHDAVVRWRETFIPDYDFLMENWEKHFPKEPRFKLCAFRELGICGEIECGADAGKPKITCPNDLGPERARHLLGAIRAQASTEFGSIQQHRLTLARAQEEVDQVWVLRMMAEELRHGYQMLHLLLEDDWSSVSDQSGPDMVEEILSMQTGSHVLGAFNIDFDSFVDNIVFCALIDRVGKYQLAMQRVSAYKPMAESMPQMLREEAFHLATGVVPMRRWATQAAEGDVYVSMEMLQKAFNKWMPRGLEMFGDERGGGSNVRMGFKPMKNGEAQEQYRVEVSKLVDDVNMRYVRARLPELGRKEAKDLLEALNKERMPQKGIAWEDLIHLSDPGFFRRRGVPAFTMTGWDGETFERYEDYIAHLRRHLPESYLAGRDFRDYAETLKQVANGELTTVDASRKMPRLSRVGGSCPCSRSVRWVTGEGASDGAGVADGEVVNAR